jgi:methylase of polypeptide subunit release factors
MNSSVAATDFQSCEVAEIFFCPEESRFYTTCLKALVFTCDPAPKTVVEFGSGDGNPVIEALHESDFAGCIEGFELDVTACDIANTSSKLNKLQDRYKITNASFFAHTERAADCLIANPPYLPAPDRNIRLPLLYGGEDGAVPTNALLSLRFNSAMLMVSSFSNPVGTIRHAAAQGYSVSDFVIMPLMFGIYSSEPKVKRRIAALRKTGKAFYDEDMYLLAGVLFKKHERAIADHSTGLIKILTAL